VRALVRRLVGPVFEATMKRLEATTEVEDHLEAVEAILAEGSTTAISAALVAQCRYELEPERESEPPESDRLEAARELAGLLQVAFGAGRFERESEVQLGSLLRPAAVPELSADDYALLEGADFGGEPAAVGAARRSATRMLVAVQLGTPVEAVREPLFALAATLDPPRWLLRKGTAYGGSALLRALVGLAAAGGGEPPDALTRSLCERLLRHVEVRREEALAFLPESLPRDPRPPRERLRFAAALLEAAEHYRDARYLNAALKLVDWHLAGPGRRGTDPVTGLHYAFAVARQERLMRELLG